ncbi:MAG: hypothetical protein HOI95_06230 [Chromatiales bacterium]|nr:hypothetical protein [Chromatiales bacterium]
MFDVQRFVEECQTALEEPEATVAVREIVERAMSKPGEVLAGLGVPERATVEKLHVADDLTIINAVWGPHMTVMPHNHEMPAIIGIYAGGEDNIFWRRVDEQPNLIRAAGARSMRAGDVEALGPNAIHSVTNPIRGLTGAVHVYLGPFFTIERNEWDPETLLEGRYNIEKNMRLFEESNARLA